MTKKRVIALGFFDGVHLGHRALLEKTLERAKILGVHSAAFTFDRSPREFVTGQRVPLLTDTAERERLVTECCGLEELLVEPFDEKMMTMSWEAFVTDLLVGKYGAVHLVAGHDYRFGHKNGGTPERLVGLCRELGLGCDVIPKVELDGVTVSSTFIRSLVEAGEMEKAARFLGRPYAVHGTVCHGYGIGKKSLFPTANLALDERAILPAFGVYATRVFAGGHEYAGVTNVGVRPTVGTGEGVSLETYVLDFAGDLYGEELRVEFLKFLRFEQHFESTAALHERIERDIAAVRKLTE